MGLIIVEADALIGKDDHAIGSARSRFVALFPLTATKKMYEW